MTTGRFVTELLQRFRHPEHGYRSCLGLLTLAKRYGPKRVEAPVRRRSNSASGNTAMCATS